MASYDLGRMATLARACRTARSNKDKGEALADLVEYVFGVIPGVELKERGVLAADGTGELDLVFQNNPFVSWLTHNVTLLVECKNEARKISAAQVRVFASKLGERNQRIGVMVTTRGLSGTRYTHAHKVVSAELANNRTIVVLTSVEIAGLADSDELVALFAARQFELEARGFYESV